LVTAARFLGYHFNPVSFWYLYDAEQRLSAMILEVNNTFDERRMYFLTADDDQPSQDAAQPKSEAEQGKCPPPLIHRRTVFTQSWPKDFHVSPFNSRKGSYTARASDPLSSSPHSTRPISITIKLASSKGNSKLVTSLSATGPPLDPYTMTPYQRLCFLASWWHVGFLTFPRILAQAARLFFQRRLHVWYRPEPLKDTISRRATETEQRLEPIFRRYLQHLVGRTSAPLCVVYTAPGGMGRCSSAELMLSPSARQMQKQRTNGKMKTAAKEVETLELRILTPAFYTRFVQYHHTNTLNALTSELDEGRTFWVSRRDLLAKLVQCEPTGLSSSGLELESRLSEKGLKGKKSKGLEAGSFWLIRLLRAGRLGRVGRLLLEKMTLGGLLDGEGKKTPGGGVGRENGMSGMDAYVLEYENDRAREIYIGCVTRVLLAERVAFGSLGLLRAEALVMQVLLAWALASVLLAHVW
jgi:hypothetical protein